MVRKAKSLKTLKGELLKDDAVRKAYESMELEFAIAHAVITARRLRGLSQAELARRMGTKQSYVARLESGRTLPSMATLRRVAEATGLRAHFAFEDV
jgi:ribosome-binding protein aMBF1 (putative translation factor)